MTDTRKEWDDLRTMADELELKIRLARMDARDRWHALQPRFVELERAVKQAGVRASKAVTDELIALGKALRELRDDIARA